MSDAHLKKLRRLHEQATPGPWTWEATGQKSNEWCLGTECEGEVVDFIAQSGTCENQADAELICEMRNALPALYNEIAELRKRLNEVRKAARFLVARLELETGALKVCSAVMLEQPITEEVARLRAGLAEALGAWSRLDTDGEDAIRIEALQTFLNPRPPQAKARP